MVAVVVVEGVHVVVVISVSGSVAVVNGRIV